MLREYTPVVFLGIYILISAYIRKIEWNRIQRIKDEEKRLIQEENFTISTLSIIGMVFLMLFLYTSIDDETIGNLTAVLVLVKELLANSKIDKKE